MKKLEIDSNKKVALVNIILQLKLHKQTEKLENKRTDIENDKRVLNLIKKLETKEQKKTKPNLIENMSTNNTFKIIEKNKECLSIFNKIEKDFYQIEKDYNSVLKKLDDDEKALKNNHAETFQLLKGQRNSKISELEKRLKKRILLEESKLNEGLFLENIVKQHITKLKSKYYYILGIGGFIGFGGLFYFIFGPMKWYQLVLFFGPINVFTDKIARKTKEKIGKATDLISNKNIFHLNNRNSLMQLSKDLEQKINQEVQSKQIEINSNIEAFKQEIENAIEEVEKDFDYKKKYQMKKEEEELKSFYENKNEIIEKLKTHINQNIQSINSTANQLISLLEKLPESFDSQKNNWNDSLIIKNKEIAAPNYRIGNNLLSITTGAQYSLNIPVCNPFLTKSNVIIEYNKIDDANKAIRVSHNFVSRALLSIPANKIKITFIDPIELGGNAAPFTPLLREIYGGRVFTQQSDIETQFSNLTRAIENVIQRYLQDKFTNIAEYNLKTKEVPEPYRLLVVYNFPHGFNDILIKKLIKIMKSGPKAGVHTVLVNDKNAKLPYGINWSMFDESNSNKIYIENNNTQNKIFSFDKSLPHNEIVEYINNELPNSSSIKVPFSKYIPQQSEWWKDDASKSFSVPIGRHALEIQNLTFNNDDDNQALLIGKPGSGKSNLLHVIIANSIWKYSPDQLEIYLIDFKGGVEFTIYADKKIPHIKTIAIESEREFGLSVLDGVERELLKREIEFSKVGVQNIEQYHKKFPNKRMPRILLIVDEFQEFFSEDDSIRQAVDEKFDRIVRKGRAFGINTLFSSQTLSGNSIKESTKELIDIRIALMCSDLDANKILDDRNPAAKDLTRPGQGIYNAENGRIEGNRIFQAFFIEKKELEKTINSVVEFAKTEAYDYTNFNQIIFRGSEKAIMNKPNHPLKKIIPTSLPKTLKIWLGEPVAITNDVTATIRQEAGSNVIVVGHDESIGARIISSSIISIATQHVPNTAKFYSFNFYNIDSKLNQYTNQLFENSLQEYVNVRNREIKKTLEEIKTEIEKRINEISTNSNNIYLCIFSFQRARGFRKDDYMMNEEGQLLSFILKEGPDVGIYTLLQVNSMDGFGKNLEENLLKEFSHRIVSQVNPDNSVKLIDSQKASKLGDNRAIYFDDNENTMIKFKPYEFVPYNEIIELRKKQSKLL